MAEQSKETKQDEKQTQTCSTTPVMKPETVARIGLRAVNRNKPFIVAGLLNRVMANFGVLMGKIRSRNMWGGLLKGIVPPELKVAPAKPVTSKQASGAARVA